MTPQEIIEGNKPIHWLEYCKSCKKNHYVMNQPCPDCGVYFTPQPVSKKVKEKCKAQYRCDGCEAYLDHLH